MISPTAHMVYDCRALPKETNANDMLASPGTLELLQPQTISIFDYTLLPPPAPQEEDHSAAILVISLLLLLIALINLLASR